MNNTKCRSCGAPIEFVQLLSGKWMPVEGPTIEISEAEVGDVLITRGGNVIKVTEINRRSSFRGRVSHFASCPNADQHRKS